MLVLARNLLIGLLLAFLLLWGFTWYQARSSFSELTRTLAPFVDIGSRSFIVWPNGDIVLRDLNIQPRLGDADPVGVEMLRLHTPGLLFLARFGLGTGRQAPDELGLTLRGLRGSQFEILQAGNQRPWLNTARLVPFESFGCGDVQVFEREHLIAMGMEPRAQSQFIGYRMDRRSGRLNLRIEVDNPPLSRIEIDAVLTGLDPQRPDPMAMQEVRVERAQLRYIDSGFLVRRNDWCGQRAGEGVSRFLRAHVGEIEALAGDFGAAPDTRLLGVYRRLINEGGSVSLEVRPSLSVPFSRYPAYAADDVLRLLNLTIRYADTASVPVDLRFAETRRRQSEQRLAEALASGDQDAVEAAQVLVEAATASPAPGEPANPATSASAGSPLEAVAQADDAARAAAAERRRRPASEPAATPVQPSIPIPRPGEIEQSVLPTERVRIGPAPPRVLAYDDLPGLVGQRITIVTVQGQRRIGILRAVDADGVRMDVQISGGTAGVTIPRQAIREIRRGAMG